MPDPNRPDIPDGTPAHPHDAPLAPASEEEAIKPTYNEVDTDDMFAPAKE